MSAPYDDDFDDHDTGDCSHCGGEGGYAVCQEDSCPHIYGEDGCDDPACWRVCRECKGRS